MKRHIMRTPSTCATIVVMLVAAASRLVISMSAGIGRFHDVRAPVRHASRGDQTATGDEAEKTGDQGGPLNAAHRTILRGEVPEFKPGEARTERCMRNC